MKLAIKRDVLLNELNNAIKGVSNKNLIPVLNGIKFELSENGLYLIGSDNDITIKTFIDKKDIEKIEECGEIVIYGKYIYEIIRKLPNEIINIEIVDNYKILIYTANSSFNLNGISANEYPRLDIEESKNPITINRQIFKNIIQQTSFASSLQESRPILTGINFKIDGDVLECTATDSYRLAKKNVHLKERFDETVNIVIPNRNLNEILKILNDNDEDMEIHIFNNKILFKFDNILIQSRLLNGTYPDTSKLIPNEFVVSFTVNGQDLYNVIDRASLLTTDAEKNIVKLSIEDDIIVVSSNIPEIGYVEEKMTVNKDNNTNLKIAFSSKYMMDAIRAISSENIKVLFNGEIKPIIIKDVNDDSIIQLILPIRTY